MTKQVKAQHSEGLIDAWGREIGGDCFSALCLSRDVLLPMYEVAMGHVVVLKEILGMGAAQPSESRWSPRAFSHPSRAAISLFVLRRKQRLREPAEQ